MGDIRKEIASAATGSNLAHSELTETALDRVMALGAAGITSPLGTSLWRLKYMNDHHEYEPALARLTKLIRRPRQSLQLMRKLCTCVLNEWLDEICRKCGGRGHIVADGTPHATAGCTACAGQGVRNPSVQRRMRLLSLSAQAYPKWEPEFNRVYSAIRSADEAAVASASAQLGRIANRSRIARKVLTAHESAGMIGVSSRPAHNSNILPELAIGSAASA